MHGMDKLRESFLQFFYDFFPDKVELFIGYLLQSGTLHVYDQSDLVDYVAHCLLASVKLFSPRMFQLSNDEFSYGLQSRVLEQVIHLDLACVDYQNRSTLFINFVEPCRHKLSNHILLPHEVMIKQHVNLEAMSPLSILSYSLQCQALVEIMSYQEPCVDSSLENHFVYLIEYLGSIDHLCEIRYLLLLLLSQIVKQTTQHSCQSLNFSKLTSFYFC